MANREIKFRAWDGVNMWHEGGNGDYFLTAGDMLARPDVTVIQFTGLKDGNGVEIFEGDILEVNLQFRNFPGDELHDHFITATVDFHDGAFWFTGGGHTHCLWFHYPEEVRRVIGNIYENPELLEKEKVIGDSDSGKSESSTDIFQTP